MLHGNHKSFGAAFTHSSKTKGPGEQGAAGYYPQILLLKSAKMVLCPFHTCFKGHYLDIFQNDLRTIITTFERIRGWCLRFVFWGVTVCAAMFS